MLPAIRWPTGRRGTPEPLLLLRRQHLRLPLAAVSPAQFLRQRQLPDHLPAAASPAAAVEAVRQEAVAVVAAAEDGEAGFLLKTFCHLLKLSVTLHHLVVLLPKDVAKEISTYEPDG